MRTKLFVVAILLAGFWFTSCSSVPKAGGGGGGTGSLSMTMVADSRPANPAVLSLRVTITGIALTRTGGSPQSLTLATQPVIDLARLQSDTAFLGTFSGIPAGQYTGVTVTFANPAITYLNDTGGTVSPPAQGCPSNNVCQATVTGTATAQANALFSVASTTPVGVGLDFNLGTAVTISGTPATLSIDFTAPTTLMAFTLPRSGSTLSAGQLDLMEDFTGVASLSGQAVTITSPTRGVLTATATSTTSFDPSPYPTRALCNGTNPTLTTCVANNQIVSADAILKSDGTLALQEIEPLVASQQDILEGIVVSKISGSSTQFIVATTDKQAATSSLISSVKVGDVVIITVGSPLNPFLVDTKGLPVTTCCTGSVQFFTVGNNTDAIHLGQTVALEVTAFTPAVGSALPSATVNTVILRWSRLIATATGAASPTSINVKNLPSYFNFTPASSFAVQVFPGTPGSAGVSNLEGLSSAANVVLDKPVAVRALYFLATDTMPANPPFLAAKLRQH